MKHSNKSFRQQLKAFAMEHGLMKSMDQRIREFEDQQFLNAKEQFVKDAKNSELFKLRFRNKKYYAVSGKHVVDLNNA